MQIELRRVRVGLTLSIVAFATLLQLLLWPWIAPAPYLLYFPAVVVCAFLGDGILATVLSGLMAHLLFNSIDARFVFQWPDLDDAIRFFVFMANGTLISRITRSLETARAKSALALIELQEEKRVREFFVTALTHDLRNPLTAAVTCAELLGRDDPRIDRVKLQKRVLSEIRRADRLIQNMLDVSRLNAGQVLGSEVKELDLSHWLTEVAEDICATRPACFVTVDARPGIMGFWSVDSLRRVIENLVGNAFKYGDTSREITLRAVDHGEKVKISVHNWGRAILPDDIPHLFTPFRRSSQAMESGQKGWGVGLSLVKGLVEAQGGKVGVQSAAQSGTTFWIELPKDARSTSERERISA